MSTTTVPDIVEFIMDPQLLGLSLSPAQETLLRAIYALPMSKSQLEIYRQCTGRQEPPGVPFTEVTIIAGARAGKDSRIAAPIAVYEGIFGGHEEHLGKGEKGIIALVAQNRDATDIAFSYMKKYLTDSALLADLVTEDLASEITLTSGLMIKCFPSTLRAPRGRTIPVAVMDELGFYRLEGQADSDAEIQMSLKRGMGTFPGRKLIKISTPYMRSGILFDDHKRAFGKDGAPLLVWVAATALMNPTMAEFLEEERNRLDPELFRREYEAAFIENIAAFLSPEIVDAAIVQHMQERPPRAFRYVAAVDMSGGRRDASTLAICHLDKETIIHDVMRGWGSHVSRASVVGEMADVLCHYRVTSVIGDDYGAEWIPESFKEHRITYISAPNRLKLQKGAAYLGLGELLRIPGRVKLLDHKVLTRELLNLERHDRPGGKPLIDHPSGDAYHDDHANALALAVVVAERQRRAQAHRRSVLEDDSEPFGEESWRPAGLDDVEEEKEDLRRQAKVAELKKQLLEAGESQENIDWMEREYSDEYIVAYLEERLEGRRNSLRARRRRAGLDY